MQILLFDMMDTLIEDPFYIATRKLMDPSRLARWTSERNPAAFLRFEAGLCTEAEYFRTFFRSGQVPEGLPSPAKLKKVMMSQVHWLPGLPELLDRVRERSNGQSLKMGVASNYSLWYRDVFRVRRDLPARFDFFFFSCEVGHRKPSTSYYDVVHNSLQCGEKLSVLFFDDREENLRVPCELGWDAVHIHEKERASSIIEEALSIRGIL